MSITLTELARQKVIDIAAEQGVDHTIARIKVLGGGCHGFQYDMFYDDAFDDAADERFEFDGVTIIIDRMSLMYIMGTEIDFIDELVGGGFKFNNPTSRGSCGCGSSFSV